MIAVSFETGIENKKDLVRNQKRAAQAVPQCRQAPLVSVDRGPECRRQMEAEMGKEDDSVNRRSVQSRRMRASSQQREAAARPEPVSVSHPWSLARVTCPEVV